MKIIGTGLSGLVGSRFTELLSNSYTFENLSLDKNINILDKESLFSFVSSSTANVFIHMAAKTNVDGCEKDKLLDLETLNLTNTKKQEEALVKSNTAYAINVLGTDNIIKICQKTNKKLIYISTDFVFDGTKKTYSEDDKPNPINWYAKTKYIGEKLIQQSGLEFLIVRLAYPYRSNFIRNDFVRGLLLKLTQNEQIEMVSDHIMVPTFIDDFVNALYTLIQKEQTGIFHVVGSQSITPYDAALKIAQNFNLNENLITKTKRLDYFRGKAPRPFCLNLKNDKISRLGIEMSDFDTGLKEIKRQMEKLKL